MKGYFLVLLILLNKSEVNSCAKRWLKSLAAPAINSIFVEYFANDSAKVNVIYFGSKATESDEIVDQVVRNKSDSITFKFQKMESKILGGENSTFHHF